ncbi:uncharacterized protein K452DRAFT_32783 [Aplosporella prunicola CBS 121167]|uniref:Suppressor of forked domain-containing protein n=1 Tax=Aplosporella prunicola CBS 121167 TaxID=1176127 RepID=A0A6A6BEM7_9PEZI|nr:uncharacterized protein K452DRAFT_32783 [Aplosporella prunicola CBS 121167]KAF2141724.1 hypothetical protein K452DRAFT_32783 [Aplosporella prunicola CBS 121167]
MADLSFLGMDDDFAELRDLNQKLFENPDDFDAWEKVVRAAESLEGGLNRNSSPSSIAATRSVYDKFLAKFPLVFGYWKKYADLEFSIAGTEAAEMVYERGVASIASSVDLWANYCAFKVDTCHDSDVIRELFERGVACVGLDFLAHPFWDKYIEFEERLEAFDRIFVILKNIILIPMHQYARYFERFRQLSQTRPVTELVPENILAQYQTELLALGPKSEVETERELRARIDTHYLEVYNKTQTEVGARWVYEAEIKRPYFHVTDLDEPQLANWRKYLDYEEANGTYERTSFLYERCLVTAAYYEEFWFRYARWMLAQPNKEQEVRNIYQRASCLFVPIAHPSIRIQYAIFEEQAGRVDVAEAIYDAILVSLPGQVETIVSWANLARRHRGIDAAITVLRGQIESAEVPSQAKGTLVAEWARLLWKIKGFPDEARQIYQANTANYLDVRAFWYGYLMFEIEQPFTPETDTTQHERIKQVHTAISTDSLLPLPTMRELTFLYMKYLLERGTKEAAKEWLQLDREINGPNSVAAPSKNRPEPKPLAPAQSVEVMPWLRRAEDIYSNF